MTSPKRTGSPENLPIQTRDVIDALARKGKVRVVVDGLTAANDLGLNDAVPAHIGVLTDGRMRPIILGNLTLDFQAAAPTVLLAAARTNPAVVLREAALTYKVDTDAIALKVKQEFAAKEKTRAVKKGPETEKQKKKQSA